MSKQMFEKNHPDYHIFPYGIWLPKDDPKLIEKIKNYIQIHVESDGYSMMYFNGSRIRTPTDSGSQPCYNCGHCIDNLFSACRNKKCVKDRKNRKLCDRNNWMGRGKSWVHDIEKNYVFQNNKNGVVYNWSICKTCGLTVKWLADYTQEQHINEYYRYLKGSQPSNLEISESYIRTSRGVYGELRHLVYQRDNYKCRECGATKEEIRLEIDHIIPWSKGGKTEFNNLQTLCRKCNHSKHTRVWVGGQ